jgi:hypothetical protein
MSDLLQEAILAKQNGDFTLAKQLLSQAIIQQPNDEGAWMLMSDVVEDIRLRRNCLEKVLAINPNNVDASTALTKLETSPLSPVTRGERDKPLNPLTLEKIPPFTPPFTWGPEQEQYLALGDLTYPDLSGERPAQPSEMTPTFDWATDSDEPDKTIDKIFNAISNPELASQSIPDTDVSKLDINTPVRASDSTQETERNKDDRWLDELVGTEVEPLPEQQLSMDDFVVSSESEIGLDAFTSPDQPIEPITSDYQLWDNPEVKTDRMVILSDKSLMYANPKESDIPHILGLFAEKKMVRDLLGENARAIKLENIRRLSANPEKADFTIEYMKRDGKLSTHKLTFSSPQVRDEVFEAIQLKPGADFHQTIETYRLLDKIVPPLAILLLLAFLIWGLYAGLPMLSGLNGEQLGLFQPIISGLQSFVSFAGRFNLSVIIFIGGLLTIAWLVNNLRKPSKLILLERD